MIQQIHPVDVARMIENGDAVYLLDVRQPHEHEYCRLPGSVLIPLGELQEHLDDVDAADDALIVVYCHHGVRSLSGAAILQHAGRTKVASMAGGIDAWTTFVDPKVPRY